MTDKQIIIDGIEVYKCRNAKRSIFGIDVECQLGGDCSQRPDCYYKQLKQAEQTVEECHKYQAELEDKLSAKEQECKELKEAQKNSRCAWKSFEGTFCPEAQQQLDQLKSENKHLNDLLNQALKEIEAIQDAYEERE